jgi:hypothetical protein
MTTPPQLVLAFRNGLDPLTGYLVDESELFVVLHHVSDRYDLDGYNVLPRRDIQKLETEFDKQDLIERALRLKGLSPKPPKPLDLTSFRGLLESVQQAYPLLVIYCERVHEDECEVGRIRLTTDDTYVLDSITPNAEWELDDRPFKYGDITMLQFDGDYENTLAMVAKDRKAH